MPRGRTAKTIPSLPMRESPRKRKREEPALNGTDTVPIIEVAKVNITETSPRKPARSGTKKQTIQTRPSDSYDQSLSPAPAEQEPDHTKAKVESSNSVPKGKATHQAKSTKSEVVSNSDTTKPPKNSAKTSTKQSVAKVDTDVPEDTPKKKRKTKEEKAAEAMPLAARSTGLKMFVGAHVSIAKGVENAITNSLHIGGNAFALFLKSQRKWENPPLKNENRDAFRKQCAEHGFDSMSHVVPHGSYLVNLATPDPDKAKQSYDAFVDDLKRCEALGIRYYNFHPGATNQEPLQEAIGRLAANLNKALSETKTVVPLLENMAGSGSVIGSRFTDLRDIIALIKPEHKSRIGVCIDTCHTFAAGYDLRTPEAYKTTLQELDDVVGLQYLRAMHINDSKAPFGSKRDLHQNVGAGFLGLRAFHNVMNDSRLENVPLVLETPCDRPDPNDPTGKKTVDDKHVWSREIKLLESLIGMDPDGDEFRKLEKDLSDQGKAEREKMSAAIDLRDAKAAKKLAKGQKSLTDMLGSKNVKGNKKRKDSVSSASNLSDIDGLEV